MPVLHAVRHQEGRSGEDSADRSIIDELAGEASAGAEEGVGRAAEVKTAGLRLVHQLAALLEVDSEGLFRKDVLAGGRAPRATRRNARRAR